MRTVYHTNVDCARLHVSELTSLMGDVQPQLGDLIKIVNLPNKVREMEVVGRSWGYSSLYKEVFLEIELHLTSFWRQMGLSAFEESLG